MNVREYRRGNTKWTIHGNWQHRGHNTKKNKTKYVLNTTIREQTQITYMRHEPSYKLLEVKTNQTNTNNVHMT